MLTGELPFVDVEHDILIEKTVLEGKRPIIPSTCPEELAELIKYCILH